MTKQEKIKEVWGENWKDVIGYENLYQVSNLGRIKSLPKKVSNGNGTFITQEKILKPYLDKSGYHTVNLYLNKKKKLHKIHRLVGIAFIDNPDNKPAINHKNSIRTDNRVENLEWVTFSENNQHAFDFGNQKPMKGDKSWIYGIDSSLHPLAKKCLICKQVGYIEHLKKQHQI